MNLNMKKVSVPVLMFLMAQSGFGVSNENFGNANRALGQSNLNRAVRCLTDEAIKKDEASGTNTELRKLLVNKNESTLQDTIKKIGAMLLKEAYIEYLVPRSDPNDAVRGALDKSSVKDMVATLVDTNLFTKDSTGKYLWWTIDGYDPKENVDDPYAGTIKGKFYAVVEEILKAVSTTEGEGGWRDTEATEEEQAETNKKHDADLLMGAITGNDEENGGIGCLKTKDFEGEGWWTYDQGQQHTAAGEKWTSVLNAINDEIYTGTSVERQRKTDNINKESIIDALQVFLGDRLMDKLIDAGKSEEDGRDGEIRTALGNFFEGHFMRKVDDCPKISKGEAFSNAFEWAYFYVKLDLEIERKSETPNEIYCKNGIYDRAYDAIHDDIEGLLRSKDAPVNLEMFDEDGIKLELFKKTLVNQLDNLAPDVGETKNRSWDAIKDIDLGKQIKRIVWIDNDDNDVAGAKESDNESYDYDSSDINGGDSDEEQAERAEEAVKEGLENADKLIDNQ